MQVYTSAVDLPDQACGGLSKLHFGTEMASTTLVTTQSTLVLQSVFRSGA
jgi:hypothetical protein